MDKEDKEIEEWIIYMLFAHGNSIKGLCRKFKLKVREIENIIRIKDQQLRKYVPINKRKPK